MMVSTMMFSSMKSGVRAAAMVVILMLALPAPARAGEILVAGFTSDSILRFDQATGDFIGGLAAPLGLINGPLAARVGPDGLLYVASETANAILRFTGDTFQYLDTFVPAGSGGLNGPTGLAWAADGSLIVSSFNSDSVLRYHGKTGAFINVFVAAGASGLNGPDNGTIFGPDGHLYVPSYWTNRIMKFHGSTGAFLGNFVPSIGRPRVLVFRDGNLYVTSETADAVLQYNATTGAFIANFVVPGAGGLDEPIGLCFGEDGFLYVTSGTLDRVLRYDAVTGAFVDVFIAAGAQGLDAPVFVTHIAGLCDLIPCPADIVANCEVNVDDLLAVINSWGPCPAIPECDADIAPKGGNNVVNVDDLLGVINGWGECGP